MVRGVKRARGAVFKMKIALGMSCMTEEASTYIATYRDILEKHASDEFLAGGEKEDVADFLKRSKGLMDRLAKEQENYDPGLDLYIPIHTMFYLLTLKTRPGKVVETGVEKGGSTFSILKGLHKNDHGQLWSVDIRDLFSYKGKPVSKAGPLIRKEYKDRWELVVGNAQKILGDVLRQTGQIDMFGANQGHTYEVQKHEVGECWPVLRSGGVLVLDRPDWNDGRFMKEFLEAHGDEVLHHETYKEGSISDPFEFSVLVKK